MNHVLRRDEMKCSTLHRNINIFCAQTGDGGRSLTITEKREKFMNVSVDNGIFSAKFSWPCTQLGIYFFNQSTFYFIEQKGNESLYNSLLSSLLSIDGKNSSGSFYKQGDLIRKTSSAGKSHHEVVTGGESLSGSLYQPAGSTYWEDY